MDQQINTETFKDSPLPFPLNDFLSSLSNFYEGNLPIINQTLPPVSKLIQSNLISFAEAGLLLSAHLALNPSFDFFRNPKYSGSASIIEENKTKNDSELRNSTARSINFLAKKS